MEQSIWYDTTISCNKTANSMAKKPSANNVLASLHRGVAIDSRELSVVYQFTTEEVCNIIVIDNRELSVVYQALEMLKILLHVIDTEKLLVCIGC